MDGLSWNTIFKMDDLVVTTIFGNIQFNHVATLLPTFFPNTWRIGPQDGRIRGFHFPTVRNFVPFWKDPFHPCPFMADQRGLFSPHILSGSPLSRVMGRVVNGGLSTKRKVYPPLTNHISKKSRLIIHP